MAVCIWLDLGLNAREKKQRGKIIKLGTGHSPNPPAQHTGVTGLQLRVRAVLVALLAVRRVPLAKMLPIGPGGPQAGFSALRYVSREFRQKIGSADSPPPRCPPGPGFLSAERGSGRGA
jgi:hypothetical protein